MRLSFKHLGKLIKSTQCCLPTICYYFTLLNRIRMKKAKYLQSASICRQQMKNQLLVMDLVENVSKRDYNIGSINESINKCRNQYDFESLWIVEGIGSHYTFNKLQNEDSFLNDVDINSNPLFYDQFNHEHAPNLCMLHAGMGFSLAKYYVTKYKLNNYDIKYIDKFIEISNRVSINGYKGCSIESLGLISLWLLYNENNIIYKIDQQVMNSVYRKYYWHGVGRMLYFHPFNNIPWYNDDIPHQSFKLLNKLYLNNCNNNDLLCQYNMISGLMWAIVLVNMRHPNILINILKYIDNEYDIQLQECVKKGIVSAVAMRYIHSGKQYTHYLSHFLTYKRDNSEEGLLWKKYIIQPVGSNLRLIIEKIHKGSSFDLIFKYDIMEDAVN
eukprot:402585_1